MAENVLEVVFRARDADRVVQASRDVAASVQGIQPAAADTTAAMQQMGTASERATESLKNAAGQGAGAATAAQSTWRQLFDSLPEGNARFDSLRETIKKLDDELKKTGSQAAPIASTEGALTRLGGTAVGIAKLAGGLALAQIGLKGVTASARGMQQAFEKSVQAAANQELADKKLAFALQGIGHYSVRVAKDMADFGNAMQRTTVFGDDTVAALSATIAQLGRLSGQSLKDATRAALDMAAALGKSADSIGFLLAKAAQGETTMLGRMGIVIDKSIPKSERFAAALAAINKAFGGTAAATADTYIGKTQQMANAMDEFREAIGERLLPTLSRLKTFGTSVFFSLADAIRGTRGETVNATEDIIASLETTIATMRGMDSGVRATLQKALEQGTQQAKAQFKIEVQRGDLDETLRVLKTIDRVLAESTAAGNATFRRFLLDMQKMALEGIDLKVKVDTVSAMADLQEDISKMRGELTLDAALRPGAFEKARDEFLGIKKDVEEPLFVPVNLDEKQIPADVEAFKAKVEKQMKSGQPVTFSLGGTPSTDIIKQDLANAAKAGVKFKYSLTPPSASEIAAEIVETQTKIDRGQQLRATIKARIDAAESRSDLAKVVDEAKQLGQEYMEKSKLEVKFKPAAQTAIDAVAYAERLAREAASQMPVEIPVRLAPFALVDEQGMQAESVLQNVLDLYRELGALAGQTSFKLFESEDIIRDSESATDAIKRMDAELDAVFRDRNPEAVAGAIATVDRYLAATAADASDANREMRAWAEQARQDLMELMQVLEPLQKADAINVRIGVAVSAQQYDLARKLYRDLVKLQELHPEIDLTVNIRAAKAALAEMENSTEQWAAKTEQLVKDAFSAGLFETVSLGLNAALDGMQSSTKQWADRIRDIFVNLVATIITEWLRMKLLLAGATFGYVPPVRNQAGQTGGTGIRTGGAPKPTAPTPTPAPKPTLPPPTPAKPLLDTGSIVQRFTPMALPSVPVVPRVVINALDSADFERYIRVGRGARALANIAMRRSGW